MRSLLFVPADNPRKLSKSLQSDADALIFDLEDSVALSQKETARQELRLFLQSIQSQPPGTPRLPKIYVRVNAIETGMTVHDLIATIPFQPHGIVLPKSQGARDIEQLSHYLETLEAQHGGHDSPDQTRIIAIATETAAALSGLSSYQHANKRLEALMWGAEDLSGDIGALSSKESDGQRWTAIFEHVRTQCLLAAASAGVTAIDCVATDIHNLEALKRETEQAYRDGFTAKAAIHPGQVPTINAAMTPNPHTVSWAHRVVEAFNKSDGVGVATMDGKMLDMPHLRLARKILSASAL